MFSNVFILLPSPISLHITVGLCIGLLALDLWFHHFFLSLDLWVWTFGNLFILLSIELLYQFLNKLFQHILMDWSAWSWYQFDGSSTGQSVVEWVEKAEIICQLCKLKEPATVILLRLLTGTYAVYQQLKEEQKNDFTKINRLFIWPFEQTHVSYQQFIECRLLPVETIDIYLTDLWKLSVLFRGMNDQMLVCTYIAGLLDEVSFCKQHAEWMNYWPEQKRNWC